MALCKSSLRYKNLGRKLQVPLKKGIDLVDQAKLKLDGYAKRFKFIMGHDIGKIESVAEWMTNFF